MVLAISVGAVAGSSGSISPRLAVVGAVSGALLSARRRVPALTIFALGLGGLGCGALAAADRTGEGAALESLAKEVPSCAIRGRVLETSGGLGTFVAIHSAECRDGAASSGGIAASDLDAPAGSAVAARAWLLPLADEGFDLARKRAGAHAELHPEDVQVSPPTGVFALAERVRNGLRRAAGSVPPAEGALLRGITIGDTDDMPPSTLDAFRRSGLSHLVAVSGSNVAIVLAGVAWATSRLPLWARIAACAAALALFVLVVGPDGSVLRAAAMGGIGLVAMVVGRDTEPMHVLGAAAALLIAMRPSSVFSLGLHLSLAATAGIILWAPRLCSWIAAPRVLTLPLAVTLAAQLGVLPLLALVFGEASVVAPLSNLAAASAVAPATVLGFVGGIVGIAHEGAGGIVLRLAEPLASWILFVAEVSSEPRWASVTIPRPLAWGSAVAVAFLALRTLRRHGEPITLRG